MKSRSKWRWLAVLSASFPLLGTACVTDFRDAFLSGWYDYVSGTTTDAFTAWLPLAEFLAGN